MALQDSQLEIIKTLINVRPGLGEGELEWTQSQSIMTPGQSEGSEAATHTESRHP